MSGKYCCISHQFHETAALNPSRIAIIHATGASQIIKRFHDNDVRDLSFDEIFKKSRISQSHPLAYAGDECFTYSQLLSAIESLSARIRSILDGSDDPYLIKPVGKEAKEFKHESIHSLAGSESSNESDQLCNRKKIHTPKIVGLYMVPSAEYIVAVLSVLRCGEAFAPLDPSWPKERILSVLSSVALDMIIGCRVPFEGSNNPELDQSHWLLQCGCCPVLCLSLTDKVEECMCSSELIFPCKRETPRSFCYLMFTSGSTGKPKGVCGTEQGLQNRFSWMQELYPLKGEELLLFKTSISFIDHLQEFICSILTASTLVIPPFKDLKGNLLYMVDFIQAYNINRLVCVPTLMKVSLPALQSLHRNVSQISLKLLILSGEVFPISLWEELSKVLPETSILNLYGSTEVSGDCTYFDCKSLSALLKTETLSSVPIGMPISNCDVVLVGGKDSNDEGEMYVSGDCTFIGYFSDPRTVSSDLVQLPDDFLYTCPMDGQRHSFYFQTGDLAKRLQSGDLIFLGRKDRTIKLNGHRIALEEIEDALRGHTNVADAAVICHGGEREGAVLEAFIVLKQNGSGENLESSLREWLVDRLPLAMILRHFSFIESFPISSTGKVDFASLMGSKKHVEDKVDNFQSSDLLHVIKKAFCDALNVDKVSSNDDFFEMGGNSIAAAHVSYNLGIDLRLMYLFPTPSKLQTALFQREHISALDVRKYGNGGVELQPSDIHVIPGHLASDISLKPRKRLLDAHHEENNVCSVISKYSKIDSNSYATAKGSRDEQQWAFCPLHPCAYSRANKVTYNEKYVVTINNQATCAKGVPRNGKGCMRQVWKVHMGSCIDASPIIVCKHEDIFLFIGSHSHKFTCVNARSGLVQWTIKLEGRIECSAAVLDDLSQVVVGCYNGKIYFLDVMEGNICWSFQTGAEVKSEPVVDMHRHLVWCGSHDHNLYALDYRSHCCIHTHPCGGSVFGSPTIDEEHGMVYVASTSGRVSALSVKALPFSTLWLHELGVPVFGSLSLSSSGNVICCLVDGSVVAVDPNGSIAWRQFKTGGPIFAGASLSLAIPSEVLICSRSGNIYSLEPENGRLLWEYSFGDPITSSAYVDENLQLVSEASITSDRLICICTSSGRIHLLRVTVNSVEESNQSRKDNVWEFARMDLQGDIFSSPVMIGGRIFVGCRDDYAYCIAVDA